MNASIKKKVNGIGLAGKIVSIVLIVLMGLGCFGLLVGTIFFAVIPKDAVLLDVNPSFDVILSKELFGDYFVKITDEDMDELNRRFNDEINTDNSPVEMTASETDEGIVMAVKTETYRFSVSQLFPVCLSALIRCATMLVIFVFLLRLADAFRVCGSPFEDGVIRRMMTFAWVLLGGAVLMGLSFTGSISGMGIYGGFGKMNYSVRFAPVLIALIVLFLASVFRYGAKLQKEADETL